MELLVFKGFAIEDILKFDVDPLYDNDVVDKYNVLKFDNEYYQMLIKNITSMVSNKYIIYEEFSFLCQRDGGTTLNNLLRTFNINLKIIYNNIYPEIYPCFLKDNNILDQFIELNNLNVEPTDFLEKMALIYNQVYLIGENYYVKYNNVEYDLTNIIKVNRYKTDPKDLHSEYETQVVYEISEDDQKYIEKMQEIISNNYTNIGIKLMGDSSRVIELYENFCAFLNTNEKYILTDYDKYGHRKELTDEFELIVKNVLKVPDFKEFKDLEFYENPNISNKLIKINQTQIMADMIEQTEKARKCEELAISTNGKKLSGYRDIFVTAPTGAGKSIMFQIPAIYLAEKYNLLTIIITPLIELMNDQVRNLHERGYNFAERLNSSINPVEKKNIVKGISEGKINLLYLAPETLLSYSIDQLIGDRKIGMVIIDEAHIVSTWGKGFRPDYWYLGSYLDKLRKTRSSKGTYNKDKIIYCFPICTFTATAVNGGKYDDVNDIKNSLNLRDTITYYGKIKRDNIKFDIKNYSENKTKNIDEYNEIKNETFKNRIKLFVDEDKKAIVYFPYANTAMAAFNADQRKGFGNLSELKDKFAIYIGSNKYSNDQKNENMMAFRNNDKKIMFATKAFGMGIDIKDIDNVYHYAVSGNLNDYVQEIGRVARSKDIKYGIASSDYYDRDLNYMKTLYGMSALHNYQVQKILSIIINIYDSKKKYNLMVTPDMFKPVFPNSDELDIKIKSALLTIEKDLANRYKGSKPIVTRARNMFTECYATIVREKEENVMNSKYGKYFKKIAKGRYNELDMKSKDPVYVTDPGDIFSINLKDLWEEQHSKKTFGEFKYELNNNPFGIFEHYSSLIKFRNKVTIKTIDGTPLSQLKFKLYQEVEIVSEVLNELQIEGGFYSKDEIAIKLEQKYNNKFKANTVANSYLDMLAEYRDIYTQNFFETKTINEEIKYRILRGNYRSIAEKMINTSPLLTAVRYCDRSDYVTYDPLAKNTNGDRDNRYDAINLALLFGLISFEVIGGNKPEIFIRINYPEKIRQIVENKVYYNNSLIDQAKNRHESDVAILKYFFTELNDDEERWNFIENYYLGKIIYKEGKILIDDQS